MDWLIFGSINIIILTIGFLVISRRLRRQYNAEQFLAQVQQEVNSIVTELNHTTERNIQLLEDRISAVRDVLDELDRRIVMANEEEGKRQRTDQTYNHLRDQRRAIQRSMGSVGGEPSPLPPPLAEQVEGLRSPELTSPVPEAERTGQDARVTVTPVPAPTQSPASNPARVSLQRASTREGIRNQVVELHGAGLDPVLIAQRCGITPGEVELIISLHGAAGR